MSDEVLAIIITVILLAGLAVWVPMLHLCDGCMARLMRRKVMPGQEAAVKDPKEFGSEAA